MTLENIYLATDLDSLGEKPNIAFVRPGATNVLPFFRALKPDFATLAASIFLIFAAFDCGGKFPLS